MQFDYAFTIPRYIEMLEAVRDGAKDEKKIYLFADGAEYHKDKGEVGEAM